MTEHDPFFKQNLPNPTNSSNKSVYLLIAESVEDASENDYYLYQKVADENQIWVTINGQKLTIAQVKKLEKEALKEVKVEIQERIPWQRVKRIINLTYKKVQKEKQ